MTILVNAYDEGDCGERYLQAHRVPLVDFFDNAEDASAALAALRNFGFYCVNPESPRSFVLRLA